MDVTRQSALDLSLGRNFEFDFQSDVRREDNRNYAFYKDLGPKRKKPAVCKHWLNGMCRGNEYTCDFYHVYDLSIMPICFFHTQGKCTNPGCIYRHPVDDRETIFCISYARGFCKLGNRCDKKHLKFDASELPNRPKHIRTAIESNRRAQNMQPIAQKRHRKNRKTSQRKKSKK